MAVELKNDINMTEHLEVPEKGVVGFTYEDPKKAPEKSALERRLLLKIDILIVGITSLVFLVNQWVNPQIHLLSSG